MTATDAGALTPDLAARFRQAEQRYRAGQAEEAARLLESILAEAPGFARGWSLLGFLDGLGGRFARAVERLERAVALAPAEAESWLYLARAYARLDRAAEAIAAYGRVTALAPGHAEANAELGALHLGRGELERALEHLQRAAAADPKSVFALRSLGAACCAANRPAAGAEALRAALALAPANAALHLQLARALIACEQGAEAVRVLQRAVSLAPQSAELHAALGNALAVECRGAEAVAALERALALEPDHAEAFGWLLREKTHACDWQDLEALTARMRRSLGARGPVPHPMVWLTLAAGAAEARRVADRWAAHELARAGAARPPGRRPERRDWVRLGYVSSDFHDHATAYLLAETIELHDRDAFEVHAYSLGPPRRGPMRRRLEQAFDVFVDLGGLPDATAAGRIAADEIDILVDLKGYTRGRRTGVIARRPAPLVVNYLGYPGTLGAGIADYIIGDRTVTPLEFAPHFAEKLVQLPHCYQPNDRRRAVGETRPRPAYGLPAAGLVLCCFNQPYKITAAMLDVWCEALAAVPGAVLWLYASREDAVANLRREARARGIDPERLVAARDAPLPEHLARLRCADLCVDTFPCNAHTTASDALWAGVPLLTLAGESFASRVAASLLRAVGLDELVSWSLDEYRALLLALVADRARLAALRARLEGGLKSAPLFDTPAYARALERAFHAMWQRALAGQPPDHIVVPA